MEEGEDGKIAIKKHRNGGLCWGKRIVCLGGMALAIFGDDGKVCCHEPSEGMRAEMRTVRDAEENQAQVNR
jgi:hypothetical protein